MILYVCHLNFGGVQVPAVRLYPSLDLRLLVIHGARVSQTVLSAYQK